MTDMQHDPIQKDIVFLVVDDLAPMRKVTSGQLRLMGVQTILNANNGLEALQVLRSRRVDMVLSDWSMPLMSGLELLKTVRSDDKLSGLPFIMITAETERLRIEEAIACGVTSLLIKPYTSGDLDFRVQRALTARPAKKLQQVPAPAPVAESPSIAVAAPGPATSEPVRQTILVVDDSPENLLLVSHLFRDEYRVRVANCAAVALQMCQSGKPPDLVLLDIMMPDMDGFELARCMQEHPASQAIPVIFVTAMTDKESCLKGFALGAVDFVTKPIDPDVLKPRVRNFMRYVELRKQAQRGYDSMVELARLHEDVEHITRHDMKGPLAGVIGLVQSLADDKLLHAGQVRQLRLVEETALQLLGMINLSSEIFKIETGRYILDARPIQISNIVHRLADIARVTFEAKQIVIAVDTDTMVDRGIASALGDAMFCYSMFQNLIKNACEAAPPGSRIGIAIRDESPLLVTIQNDGAVPHAIRGRFFDKFVTAAKEGGTGLGTYSAKLLVEAQKGSIALSVSDEKNQTTISVTLPRLSA